MVKIVIDSYAWIEIFLGSEKGQFASKTIEESDQAITPGIVLAEISRKYIREGVSEQSIHKRLATISQSSELSTIDEDIAVESGKAYMEILERSKKSKSKNPSLFDAIILATSRVNEAKVLTGDLHFKDLPETIWLE